MSKVENKTTLKTLYKMTVFQNSFNKHQILKEVFQTNHKKEKV